MNVQAQCKWFWLPLGLLTVSVAQSAPSAPQKNRAAGVVRTELAGHELGKVYVRKFDSRQGYFLVGRIDGTDSAEMVRYLALYPDPAKTGYRPMGYNEQAPLQRVSLPNIRVGWGVNIGDTPRQVRQKLGREPNFSSTHKWSGILSYLYKDVIFVSLDGERQKWEYSAKYRFEKGRLRSIEYEARNPLPDV